MFQATTTHIRILALGIILTGPQLISAQETPVAQNGDAPLKEILAELRGIRQALDRALVAQSQLMLSAEQVKIAYQALTTATDRLDAADAQLSLVQAGIAEATRNAESLENQLNRSIDLDQRTTLDQQLKEVEYLLFVRGAALPLYGGRAQARAADPRPR